MKILIIDDEQNLRRMLRALLEEDGHGVIEADSAEAGFRLLGDHEPDTILLDVALPGASGLEMLPQFRERLPGTPIVMMSGEATLSDAARATRDGAFHFLEKPLSPEAVMATVRASLEVRRALALNRTLQEELAPERQLIGESRAMQEVRDTIRKVARTDARVLITGESGTGKELVAGAIHALSERSDRPFIRVNSAAIPRDLVESEMFGHERGAFTGAVERRAGRFELAHRGTLFLDEVGDLSEEAQAKLLRVLESGTLQRVGSGEAIQVDVRLLSATNRELREEVRQSRFREDLLFRLEVVPIRIPPLRDRPEDLDDLVDHIRARLRARQGLQVPDVADSAMEAFRTHSWPGNVRELVNLLERLAILHPPGAVTRDSLHPFLTRSRGDIPGPSFRLGDPRTLTDRLDEFERGLIHAALSATAGNVTDAARELRTDRANLYRRMRRLGLRQDD